MVRLLLGSGRVPVGFDRVIVCLPSSRRPKRVGCTIRLIRPINTQVVKSLSQSRPAWHVRSEILP
jgi:hypothetical protein